MATLIKQGHIYYDLNSQDIVKCLDVYEDNTAKVVKAYIKLDENENGVSIIPHPEYNPYTISTSKLTADIITQQRFHKNRLFRVSKALEVLVLKGKEKEMKLKLNKEDVNGTTK